MAVISCMSKFELHQQLKSDCFQLGTLGNSLILLMNNALVPWFLIVPETSKMEIYDLSDTEREDLYSNINRVSKFLVSHFSVDKINVASIGNVVNQMHVHIVGRRHDDFCWPGVVWGRPERADYAEGEVERIVEKLSADFVNDFSVIKD